MECGILNRRKVKPGIFNNLNIIIEFMKLIVSIFTLLCFIQLDTIAQHTFQHQFQRPNDQEINHIIELEEGGYILVGRNSDYELAEFEGYIIHLSANGEILQERNHQNLLNRSIFYDVYQTGQGLVILGGSYATNNRSVYGLLYAELNADLELLDHKVSALYEDRWISHMRSIKDENGDYVVAGYTTRSRSIIDELAGGYNNDTFVYKLSQTGDSLASVYLTTNTPYKVFFDVLQSADNQKYYTFTSYMIDTLTTGGIVIYDLSLDSLDYREVPNSLRDNYSPLRLNENTILICGKVHAPNNNYKLNALTLTEEFEAIDFNSFQYNNLREHPARYKGVDKYEDNIYVSGTSNFDYANPFYSSKKSYFHLVKVNPDLSPIWEYWYGGDAYYFLYSIAATSDGGCIMAGNRYDYTTQSPNRDVYVVKVDENGLVVNTDELAYVAANEAIIYPNPGGNEINLHIAVQHKQAVFELYDLNGRLCLKQHINNPYVCLDVSHLLPATYIYHITNGSGLNESGKWVKQ